MIRNFKKNICFFKLKDNENLVKVNEDSKQHRNETAVLEHVEFTPSGHFVSNK